MKLRLLIFIILFSSALFPQTQNEAQRLLKSGVKDTVWVGKMLGLTERLMDEDPPAAFELILKVQDISRKINYSNGLKKAYLQQIDFYQGMGEFDSVAVIARSLLKLARNDGDSVAVSRALMQLAIVAGEKVDYETSFDYFDQATLAIDTLVERGIYASIMTNRAIYKSRIGKHADAYNDYLTAAAIFEDEKMYRNLAVSYNNLGLESTRIEMWERAIQYYKKGVELSRKHNLLPELAMIYGNLGTAYDETKNTTKALESFLESNRISEKLGQTFRIAQNLSNIGYLYLDLQEFDSAKVYFRASLDLSYRLGITVGIMYNYLGLGDAALRKKDLATARMAYDSTVYYAQKLQAVEIEHSAYAGLAKLFEETGDFAKAFFYIKKYSEYRDSVNTAQIAAKVLEFEKEQKSNQQLKLISELEAEAAERRFINVLLAMIVIISILISIFFVYKRRISQREEQLARENAATLEKLSEELAESNSWKTRLFSVISHDIKGPFYPIRSFAEILSSETDSLSREEIRDFALNLHQASNSVYYLIENLLDWAKLQQESPKPDPELLPLTQLFQRATRDLQTLFNEKNLKVEVDIPDDLNIIADHRMAHSIIHNLLHNAAKFSYRDGVIEISAANQGERVSFTIRDHGTGMPHEVAENLFSPQVNKSSHGTGKETGTGLGMLLTGEFVRLNNGTITVNSVEGKGTEFTVKMPTG